MSPAAVLALGFFLGMRHATDADHVVAVSTIITRQRSLRAALPIGALWGLGHTLTILLVGGAILLFGVVIPPRLGLGMEFSVALMLVVLGALNVRSVLKDARSIAHQHTGDGQPGAPHSHGGHVHSHGEQPRGALRPLLIGIVHGMAGSAAVALLVLGAIGNPYLGLIYLLVFGVGTIAGMVLITCVLAVPLAVAAPRFASFQRVLAVGTGLASVALGALLVYEIGFVDGLFGAQPQWDPH
jgi:ABC-type nickel/cobalt efflux system permease component RcnA